jgi:predicted phosphodiesterase
MKIQYLSDLHFEFPQNRKWLKENPIIPKGEILLVAGDTYHLGNQFTNPWIFDELSDKFEQVFLIPGNHEYYGKFDVAQSKDQLQIEIRPNVTLFHNHAMEYKGVQFIFSTLWSKVEKHVAAVYKGMYDFRQIHFEGEPFSIENYNELHQASLDFLTNALQQNTADKCVVMTHHLPSEKCNAPEFQGSALNEGFCTDLTKWIEDLPIDFWIYGHSHRNMPDFKIGGTQLLTNQLGYVGFGEHGSFRRDAIFEI